MFVRALASEWLKQRRTPALWLTLLFPLVFMLGMSWYLTASHRLEWNNMLQFSFGAWLAIWPAGGVALQAALAAELDVQENNWRALLVRPVSPATLLGAKLLVQAAHLLLHTLMLSAATILAGFLLHMQGAVPWSILLLLSLGTVLFTLPLQVLYMWVATAKGMGLAIGIGAVGLLLGPLLGATSMGEKVWAYIPWAWPFRLYMLLTGIWSDFHGDFAAPFIQPALQIMYVVLIVSLILLLVLVLVSLVWFQRREQGNVVHSA